MGIIPQSHHRTRNSSSINVFRNRYSCNYSNFTFAKKIQHTESMLKIKLKTEVRPKLLGDETKTAIKDEIDGIEKMTEEDFDRLLVMIKGLRLPVLRDPRPHTDVQDVVLFITLSLNFGATVVLRRQIPQSLFRTLISYEHTKAIS